MWVNKYVGSMWGMLHRVSLISPTIDQFVSFRLLTEVCTIREYKVIHIIFYRFMHNKGIRSHTDNILQIYAQYRKTLHNCVCRYT